MKRLHPEAYSAYFAPKAVGGPSGLATPPRPFVFRISETEIGLNLFATDPAVMDLFCGVMRELGFELAESPVLLRLPLGERQGRVTKVRVRFDSPTELERVPASVEGIEFAVTQHLRDQIGRAHV